MGITPLSTPISTRGKSVEGNTDTGIVKARYDPSRPSVSVRKMTGGKCCAIQCSAVESAAFGEFTPRLRNYFSLELSPDFASGAFAPSAGASGAASAVSILIFVLSGKP